MLVALRLFGIPVTQKPLDILLCRQHFEHIAFLCVLPCVNGFFLGGEGGVFLLQHIHGGQFIKANTIKICFSGLSLGKRLFVFGFEFI
jgi:hypothetical protein